MYLFLNFGRLKSTVINRLDTTATASRVCALLFSANSVSGGSMRLGKDALVFTKHLNSISVGFLSQTYLTAINASTVYVPIVTWTHSGKCTLSYSPSDEVVIGDKEARECLNIITTYSPFHSELALLNEFKEIPGTGTRIIIFNMRYPLCLQSEWFRKENNLLEFDFEEDPKDIRIRGDPPDPDTPQRKRYKRDSNTSYEVPLDYSLRVCMRKLV